MLIFLYIFKKKRGKSHENDDLLNFGQNSYLTNLFSNKAQDIGEIFFDEKSCLCIESIHFQS